VGWDAGGGGMYKVRGDKAVGAPKLPVALLIDGQHQVHYLLQVTPHAPTLPSQAINLPYQVPHHPLTRLQKSSPVYCLVSRVNLGNKEGKGWGGGGSCASFPALLERGDKAKKQWWWLWSPPRACL